MAQLDLYIDTFSQSLVTGPTNSAPFQFPNLFQGDTVSLRVFLLVRNTNWPQSFNGAAAYAIVPVGPLSLKLAIGDRAGNGTGNWIASQLAWTKSADGTNFTANLALNTTEVNTAIGAGQSTTKYLEIQFTQAGLPTTCLQQQVTILADVIKNTGVVPVPGETALSVELANATYLKKDGTGDAGDVKVWVSPDGTKRMLMYLGNDGDLHTDKI